MSYTPPVLANGEGYKWGYILRFVPNRLPSLARNALSGLKKPSPPVVGHPPDSDPLPCAPTLLPLTRVFGYRVSALSFTKGAPTETIGVGRTVRRAARPSLRCALLGLAGRTGPTTGGLVSDDKERGLRHDASR